MKNLNQFKTPEFKAEINDNYYYMGKVLFKYLGLSNFKSKQIQEKLKNSNSIKFVQQNKVKHQILILFF